VVGTHGLIKCVAAWFLVFNNKIGHKYRSMF